MKKIILLFLVFTCILFGADTTGTSLNRSVNGMLRQQIHNMADTTIASAGIVCISDSTDTLFIFVKNSDVAYIYTSTTNKLDIGKLLNKVRNIFARHADFDTTYIGVFGENVDADQKNITDLNKSAVDTLVSNSGNLIIIGYGTGIVSIPDTLLVSDISSSGSIEIRASGDNDNLFTLTTTSNVPILSVLGASDKADAIQITANDGNVLVTAPDTLKIKTTGGTYRYVRAYTASNVPTIQAVGGTNNANSFVVTADDGNLVMTAPDTLKFKYSGMTYRYIREYSASNVQTIQSVGGTDKTDALEITTDDGNLFLNPADSIVVDKPLVIGTVVLPDANDGAMLGTDSKNFSEVNARQGDFDSTYVGVLGENLDANQKMVSDLGTLKTDSVTSNSGNLKLSGTGTGDVALTDSLSIGVEKIQNLLNLSMDGNYNTAPGIDFFGTINTGAETIYNTGRIYSKFASTGYNTARVTIATPTAEDAFTDVLTINNGNIGVGDSLPPFLISGMGTTPIFNLTDSDVNILTNTTNQASDSASVIISAESAAPYIKIGGATNSVDQSISSLSLRGDADSDVSATTAEVINLTLTANANPALATWGFTSTQSSGYTFDKTVRIDSLSVTGGALIDTLSFNIYDYLYFVIEGNSLSDDSEDWPNYLDDTSSYFAKGTVINYALSGATVANMVTDYAAQGHISAPTANNDEAYFMVMGGINDINAGTDAPTIFTNLKTLWAEARVDGYKVVAFTLLPAQMISSPENVQRLALNDSILYNQSLYDYLVRPDLALPNTADATYYSDGTHLTIAGSKVVANLVVESILTNKVLNGMLLANQNYIYDLGTLATDSVISNSGNLVVSGAGTGYVSVTDSLDVVSLLTAGSMVSDATVTATTTMSTGANGGTSGQVNFIASDNDQVNIAINTSDQIVFTGAAGGVVAATGTPILVGTTQWSASGKDSINGAVIAYGTVVDGMLASDYQPLEATLTDIADGTIAENLVNTANPWADDEVADNITASSYVLLTAVDDSAAFQVTKSLTEAKTITGNWVNTTNPWADNEVADNITASSYTLLTAFDDSLNNAHTVTSKWIFSQSGNGALVVNDSAFVDTLTTTVLNANTSITSGIDNTTSGNLSLLGGATTVGPKFTLYNSVDEDDTEDYWSMEPQGTNFWFGSVSDLDQFIFSNAGNFTASGNVAGATYGSDASISNAELLTLDDGATTEILVGGGAGSAPVWTTATGTGAPVRAGSPTVTGTLTVDNVSGDYFTSNIGEDIDFDTDQTIVISTFPGYGLLIVRETTATEICMFLIAGSVIEKVSADATFTITQDNAATYNVYIDAGDLTIQNKVGDNKNVRVAIYGVD